VIRYDEVSVKNSNANNCLSSNDLLDYSGLNAANSSDPEKVRLAQRSTALSTPVLPSWPAGFPDCAPESIERFHCSVALRGWSIHSRKIQVEWFVVRKVPDTEPKNCSSLVKRDGIKSRATGDVSRSTERPAFNCANTVFEPYLLHLRELHFERKQPPVLLESSIVSERGWSPWKRRGSLERSSPPDTPRQALSCETDQAVDMRRQAFTARRANVALTPRAFLIASSPQD
jgi:hypothetical protein